MRWSSGIFSILCLLSGCSGALDESLSRGAELQRSEQPAEALRSFREARVEYPEAADLVFAMAGAEVALGDQVLAAHDLEAAIRQFEAARATFSRCGDEVRLAESAAYNAATGLLRVDQVLDRKGDHAARVENLKRAVEALSAVTETWPDNERAAKNLDYARYRLALLLQEPPSPEEEEKENPEEDEKPVSEVAGATTQIPGATAEVVDGAMVVLHVERPGEAVP